jgi:hypothetical protein
VATHGMWEGDQFALANTSSQFCICKSTGHLVHGGIRDYDTICVRVLHSCFADRIIAKSVRTGNSGFAASGSNRSSSGNKGPGDSPDIPDDKSERAAGRGERKVFMGTIFMDGNVYVLRSGNDKYRLDSPRKAKNYEGKDVQITGTLDDDKKLIRIEKIRVSPAM